LSDHVKLVQLRDAAKVLGISYSTLKRGSIHEKIQTVQNQADIIAFRKANWDKHFTLPKGAHHFLTSRQFRRISAR